MNIKLRARSKYDVETYKIQDWWYLKQAKYGDLEVVEFIWNYDNNTGYSFEYVLDQQEDWEIQMFINNEWIDIKIEI